jgi:hypothetical protein
MVKPEIRAIFGHIRHRTKTNKTQKQNTTQKTKKDGPLKIPGGIKVLAKGK